MTHLLGGSLCSWSSATLLNRCAGSPRLSGDGERRSRPQARCFDWLSDLPRAAESTVSPGEPRRVVYFAILLPASSPASPAGITLWRAYRRRFDRHMRIARWTPCSGFMSITGIIVLFDGFTSCVEDASTVR